MQRSGEDYLTPRIASQRLRNFFFKRFERRLLKVKAQRQRLKRPVITVQIAYHRHHLISGVTSGQTAYDRRTLLVANDRKGHMIGQRQIFYQKQLQWRHFLVLLAVFSILP